MDFDVGETLKRKDDYFHTPYYKGAPRFLTPHAG